MLAYKTHFDALKASIASNSVLAAATAAAAAADANVDGRSYAKRNVCRKSAATRRPTFATGGSCRQPVAN
jgi:hypothetical protein